MAFCESNANLIPSEREVLLCTGAKTYGEEHIRYIITVIPKMFYG
jgi:hypothetical protein